jgi:hypothetical protein
LPAINPGVSAIGTAQREFARFIHRQRCPVRPFAPLGLRPNSAALSPFPDFLLRLKTSPAMTMEEMDDANI